jgi:hypothetical protein
VRIGFNDRSALSRAYLRLDRSVIISLCKFAWFSAAIRADTMRYDGDTTQRCSSISHRRQVSIRVAFADPIALSRVRRYHARKFEKRRTSQLDRLKHRRYYVRIDSSDREDKFN